MNGLSLQRSNSGRICAATATLRMLVRRAADLRRLYIHAAGVSEPGLRTVFSDNANTLDLLIGDLQVQVREHGGEHAMTSVWRRSAHRRLSSWFLHATPRSSDAWIRLLGIRERALLQAFERAMLTTHPSVASVVRRQVSRLHSIQLDMDILAGVTR